MRLIWEMHPLEHLTGFLSSLIVVMTAVSMIYPKTRKAIMRHLQDKGKLQRMDTDRRQLNSRLDAVDDRLDVVELSSVTNPARSALQRMHSGGEAGVDDTDRIGQHRASLWGVSPAGRQRDGHGTIQTRQAAADQIGKLGRKLKKE